MGVSIRFRYHRGQRDAPRSYPYTVEWRRLPCALVEMADRTGWVVDVEGAPQQRVRGGEVLVIPAERRHRFSMAPGTWMKATWVLASWEWMVGLDVVRLMNVPHVLPKRTGKRVMPLMRGLLAHAAGAEAGDAASLARQHATGFELLEELARHARVADLSRPDPELERVQPVLRFVADNIHQPIGRSEMAAVLGLSPTRFHTVFKSAMNVSPVEYVQRARLQRARELLISTDLPVYRVAELCGFSSSYYFCRVFRTNQKTTPTAFRRSVTRRG